MTHLTNMSSRRHPQSWKLTPKSSITNLWGRRAMQSGEGASPRGATGRPRRRRARSRPARLRRPRARARAPAATRTGGAAGSRTPARPLPSRSPAPAAQPPPPIRGSSSSPPPPPPPSDEGEGRSPATRRPCANVRMDLKSQGSSRSPQGHGHLKQTKGGGRRGGGHLSGERSGGSADEAAAAAAAADWSRAWGMNGRRSAAQHNSIQRLTSNSLEYWTRPLLLRYFHKIPQN